MIRFAVVGTNFITDYILTAAKEVDGFSLTAVHSRDEHRAKDYAKQWGAPLWFTSLDDLAASKEVDAVYIATPNFTHKEYAIKMMQAGKHVLVEKSVAANEAEFLDMMDVAKQKSVVLLEALRTAFNPDYLLIKESLKKLGTLRRAIFSSCSYSRRYDNFKAGVIENAFKPEMANGALMDLGIYTVNFMTGLFGAPESVNASVIKLHNGVDGVGTITAAYDTFLATCFYGKVAKSANYNEIHGEDGYMVIESLTSPSKVTIHYNDGSTEQLSLLGTPFRADLKFELEHFIQFIENKDGGEAPYNERSRISMRVMDEAREQTSIVFPNDYQN